VVEIFKPKIPGNIIEAILLLENEWFKYVGGIVELLWRLLQWSLKRGLFLGAEVGYWEICIMDP